MSAKEIRYELPYPVAFSSLVYVDRLSDEKWYTPRHYHDYFELTYIEEGNAWFMLDGAIHRAGAGEMFFTRPGEIHCGGAAGELPFVLYAVGFHFEQMRELEASYYKIGNRRMITDEGHLFKTFSEEMIDEMEAG